METQLDTYFDKDTLYEETLLEEPEGLPEDSKPNYPQDEFTPDNPLKIYLGEIRSFPLLSREEEVTLAREIEGRFKVTRERIRQIEGKVLRKSRHPKRSKILKNFKVNA